MRVNIFDIDNKGNASFTKHVKDIWYFQHIRDTYGDQNALKLFQIFDKCYDLNPQTNVFANLPENKKFETILRSTYPELEVTVDLEDDVIIQAIDLVEELYETEKYRAHKAIKIAYNRVIDELKFTHVSLSKEDGNMGEINKALSAFDDLNKKLSSSYKELEEEMNMIQVRGDGKKRRKTQEDLD